MSSDRNEDPIAARGPDTSGHAIDWSRRDPVSSAVVEAVAAETDSDVLSLPPLQEVVDADALDRLFARDTKGRVSFTYAGFAVSVSTKDGVTVS